MSWFQIGLIQIVQKNERRRIQVYLERLSELRKLMRGKSDHAYIQGERRLYDATKRKEV